MILKQQLLLLFCYTYTVICRTNKINIIYRKTDILLFIIVALHFFVTICQQFLLKSILNFNMTEKVIVTSRNKDEENDEPRRVTSVKVVYKNVCVLGLGFFCLFTAFIALQNLQSSIHKDQHLGVVSLSWINIQYGTLIYFLLYVVKNYLYRRCNLQLL